MAGRTRSSSMQSAETSESICKHCSKKVLNKVKCVKCKHVFHPTCLKQSADQKNPECRHEVDNLAYDKDELITEEKFLKEENMLLKQIIKDKDTIIADKDFLIVLLRDKIASLENKPQSYQSLENIPLGIKNTSSDLDQKMNTEHKNPPSVSADDKGKNVKLVNKQGHSSGAAANSLSIEKQGDTTFLEKQIARNLLEVKTKQKCNEIIYLNNDNENDDSQGFTEVRRHKKRGMEGSGNGDADFYGRQNNGKKIWLFITKIPDRIEENSIVNYIKTRTSSNDISVKKLHTRSARKDNQSFMIGVEPHLKHQIYESSFWPKNIIYSRFNFKRGQHFLQSARQEQNHNIHEESERQNSFL